MKCEGSRAWSIARGKSVCARLKIATVKAAEAREKTGRMVIGYPVPQGFVGSNPTPRTPRYNTPTFLPMKQELDAFGVRAV